jgi:hypothetical protein
VKFPSAEHNRGRIIQPDADVYLFLFAALYRNFILIYKELSVSCTFYDDWSTLFAQSYFERNIESREPYFTRSNFRTFYANSDIAPDLSELAFFLLVPELMNS